MARTKEELEYLIEKRGLAPKDSLKVRPLTMREINGMHEYTYSWHEQNNLKNVNAAIEEPKIKAENKKNDEIAKAHRQNTYSIADYAGHEDEFNASLEEARKFAARYPQFRNDYVPNRDALISWMKSQNLTWTYENLVLAFTTLATEGKLLLNPSAIGIGTDDQVSGQSLVRHPELHRILEPAMTVKEAEKLLERVMSAEEYKKAHIEDWNPGRLSDYQLKSWNQVIATFKESRPDYIPTDANRQKMLKFISSRGLQLNVQCLEAAYRALKNELELNSSSVQEEQVVRSANLGGSTPGFPSKSEKYSFQKKIDGMTANEFQQRINKDSQFRAAVNALG